MMTAGGGRRSTLVVSVTARREGWIDENRVVDMAEMLKDGI